MKKIKQMKGKLLLFLTTAIFILCAAFLIVSCGNKPQQKTKDANAGPYAVDFSTAASGGPCPDDPCTGLAPGTTLNPVPSIDRSPFTLEAWVKRKTAGSLSGSIFGFMDSKGGLLYVKNNVPKFVIRRLPAAGDEVEAARSALSECVQNKTTSTECIVQSVSSVVGRTTTTKAATLTYPTSTTLLYISRTTFPPTTTDLGLKNVTLNSASPTSTFTDPDTLGIIRIDDASTAYAITFAQKITSTIPKTTFNISVSATTAIDAVSTLVKDVWTHIAGVLTTEDQSSGPNRCATVGAEQPHLAIYIDGTLRNCAGANSQYAGTSGANRFSIATGGIDSLLDVLPGIGAWAGIASFEGVIDEVRAWNYARPASKIAKCMNTELGIGSGDCDRDPGLIGYYRFNEGEGKDITDLSGHGLSGSFEDGAAKEYEHGWVPGAPISPAD